jgi:phosphate-selective porin OprO/OprP
MATGSRQGWRRSWWAVACVCMGLGTVGDLRAQSGADYDGSFTRLPDIGEAASEQKPWFHTLETKQSPTIGLMDAESVDAETVDDSVERQLAAQRDEIEQLRRSLQELQQSVTKSQDRISAVENEKKESGKELDDSTKDKAKQSGKDDGGKDGAKVPEGEWQDLSSEKWTVKLGGHVQFDYVLWANADPAIEDADNFFEFRRVRLVADGTGYGVYDFRLQATLEPETIGESATGLVTTPDVKDAYFSINEVPWLGRARIGNFFVPFSLEQVTNDTNNVFLERSIPTQGVFAADRDLGVAFYNATENRRVTWTTGMFFDNVSDALKERIDDNQGYRISGRLTCLPYYDEPSNGRYMVHLGTGILHTKDQDGRVRFRARPQIHEGPRLIDSGILDADSYTTGNVEAAVVWGQFALQSEAFVSAVDLRDTDDVRFSGAYVHGSWFLTGENRIFEPFGQHGAQFARNAPFNNVFAVPGFASLGAWELKTRWSVLDLESVERGQYNDFTAGFNWYWSDRTRIMFDWIHPITSEEAVFGDVEADILAMRFDFNW